MDAVTGQSRYTRAAHIYLVNSVAWSPDGKRLASGSHDGTVITWDLTPLVE